jgi:predicted nucleic acid-binding protein
MGAVSFVSLAELYEGTYRSANPETAQQAIKDLLSGYEMLNLSDAIVATFGRLRALLRRQGRLIPDLDLMIASTALAHDLTLVTRNQRHFSRVPQLRLYLPIDQG